MSSYEVPEPIISAPFEEPREHWNIVEGEVPERVAGRRKAVYFYRDPKAAPGKRGGEGVGTVIELKLVNLIRERVAEWRRAGYPGVTRTSLELLSWWRREGREQRLFFAQMEAAETISFLNEARGDFEICAPSHRHAGQFVAEGMRGMGPRGRRSAASGFHTGLQKHADSQSGLRVAGRGQSSGRHTSRENRRVQEQ
jgi:type III restriction enzyme